MRSMTTRWLIRPIALTLLLGVAACATTNAPLVRYDNGAQTAAYYPVGGQNSQADLQAALQACDQRGGPVQDGYTSRAYRQCMLEQGWRYGYATRDGEYPDPYHVGMLCHDIVVFGVVGSSCSNF